MTKFRKSSGGTKKFIVTKKQTKPVEEEKSLNVTKKGKKTNKPIKKESSSLKQSTDPELIRLNKYIANAGVCSRREADELIESGAIAVNEEVITVLGTKIKRTDIVKYQGKTLKIENHTYILINKPKDYITTVDDPQGRKTVMHLIQGACNERVYPVGRLDRATTGILLLTNDGELTKKLTHPKHGVKKIYHVTLDKNVEKEDLTRLIEGVDLEDGLVKADKADYHELMDKKHIGIELHSGKNRVIRRMMEALGYKVVKLDRVSFGDLTKKGLPAGKWRMLEEREIAMLKMVK